VYQENIPHTITPPPPACTVVTRHDGSMFSFCLRQVLTPPSECQQKSRQHFSSLQLSNFGELLQIVASFFLFVVEMSGTRWGHLLFSSQGCACCGFTNALLHILVVTSGNFSQSCSFISLNQSAHSDLTSSINKAFSPTGLPHTEFFVNPRNGGKSQ